VRRPRFVVAVADERRSDLDKLFAESFDSLRKLVKLELLLADDLLQLDDALVLKRDGGFKLDESVFHYPEIAR
jgi:hypothetical protein